MSTRTANRSTANEDQAQIVVAGQWRLIWRKFRKHRLAMSSGVVILLIYLVVLVPGFFAPYTPEEYGADFTYAPPQTIRLLNRTDEGLRIAPFVHGYKVEIDYNAGRRNFVIDKEVKYPVGLFVRGAPYKVLGLFESDIHLFGPINAGDPLYLLGADRLGRDVLTRTVYGAQVSMTIGLIGVALSLFFGILLGGISGYYGGWVDNFIQRLIEFLRSLPSIPLWIGLAAAIPKETPPMQVYFFITVILSVIGWTGLARDVRGRFMALKTEDFVNAAKLDGCSTRRIVFRHMVPTFLSHIIAVVTLAIPGMIIAETSLSFLGIGLRPPVISWGVLLQEAQNIRSISTAPWLFWPGVAVTVSVLALNFLGDGLRDAADPYA